LTDEALRAVSSLPSLTFIDLAGCDKVTAAGVQALRNTTATPHLHIEWEPPAEVEEDAEDSDEDGSSVRVASLLRQVPDYKQNFFRVTLLPFSRTHSYSPPWLSNVPRCRLCMRSVNLGPSSCNRAL
jgi:hypothetical protein